MLEGSGDVPLYYKKYHGKTDHPVFYGRAHPGAHSGNPDLLLFQGDTLKNAAYDHIASINEIKKQQALEYLQNRMRNIVLLSRSDHIRKMLETGAYNEMRPVLTYHMNVFAFSDIHSDRPRTAHPLCGGDQDRAAGIETMSRRPWNKYRANDGNHHRFP
jgi:hypothetical protein